MHRGGGRHKARAYAGMKPKKGTIKRLLKYVGEYKFRLVLVLICIFRPEHLYWKH